MQGKLWLVVGLAVGYVVGTRRGREGYNQLKRQAQSIWRNPQVQKTVGDAQQVVKDKVPVVGKVVSDAVDKAKPATPAAETGPVGGA